MTRAVALIVAAGRGHRVGGPLPKQYRTLAGRSVLHHSVTAFALHPAIDAVRVVIHPDDAPLYESALAGADAGVADTLLPWVSGGATRQDSVRNGLQSLRDGAPDIVLIHDGARPLVSEPVISATIGALDAHDGAIAALPLSDTLKRATDADERPSVVAATVDRAGLWRAQTPQTFRYAAILAAHEAAQTDDFTDDAAVAEAAGLRVALTPGEEENIKITQETDFARAAGIIADRAHHPEGESRVGHGFDVHRFGAGDHIMLCGVRVPHDHGVVSHSDGDVGLHAVVDAILGAIGADDIGSHFPPSDPRWRNADSAIFIARARDLLEDRGAALSHADITVICQAPRIGPHRPAMRARLATLLGVTEDRVSVKATTTERLGFTGRGEGIAAHAVVTVRMLDALR